MIIGIQFQIPNEWGNVLNDILTGIELEKYIFKIDDDEIHLENNSFLFTDRIIEGNRFKKIISQSTYYVVSVNIQGYIKKTYEEKSEVNSIEEFIRSNCDIMITIVDNIFVDIYTKSKEQLEQIKINAQKNQYNEIEEINI